MHLARQPNHYISINAGARADLGKVEVLLLSFFHHLIHMNTMLLVTVCVVAELIILDGFKLNAPEIGRE